MTFEGKSALQKRTPRDVLSDPGSVFVADLHVRDVERGEAIQTWRVKTPCVQRPYVPKTEVSII